MDFAFRKARNVTNNGIVSELGQDKRGGVHYTFTIILSKLTTSLYCQELVVKGIFKVRGNFESPSSPKWPPEINTGSTRVNCPCWNVAQGEHHWALSQWRAHSLWEGQRQTGTLFYTPTLTRARTCLTHTHTHTEQSKFPWQESFWQIVSSQLVFRPLLHERERERERACLCMWCVCACTPHCQGVCVRVCVCERTRLSVSVCSTALIALRKEKWRKEAAGRPVIRSWGSKGYNYMYVSTG